MLASLANAWKIPELRTKLIFTSAMIVIYRFGANIPVPGIDISKIQGYISNSGGDIFNFLNLFREARSAVSRFLPWESCRILRPPLFCSC